MPVPDPSLVQISTIVHEFLSIQINDASLAGTFLHYSIIDSNREVMRKGHFKGMTVQLRLSHLKDGQYTLLLGDNPEDMAEFKFDKRSPAATDDLEIRVY
jgi:hypothetical protein